MNKSYPKKLKSSRVKFPSLALLEQISEKVKNIRNKRGEYKRKIHYGCYLLCSKSGLRISEAVKFDLKAKTSKGLYRIEKPKGKKERLVYIPKEVIGELKKQNWKPHQTNRWNFYHFLRKIKRELNVNRNIELTPHTFRRSFTTYHAENGLPLPLLSKLLGHSSIRTTALYWQNIHGNDDPRDILTGKKWLENKEPPKSPPAENFPQSPKNPDSDIVRNKPLITPRKPNNQERSLDNFDKLSDISPSLIRTKPKPTITNYQPQPTIRQISPKTPEKFFLNTSEQLPVITSEKEQSTKHGILLTKIKNLEEQLKQVQAENNNLRLEINRINSAEQNKHLKVLIRQDQATEAKVIQSLPLKIKN